jgi:catechol 2,3-dioxygenase-like lactoylglutathione lyase family enzyme
MGEEEGGKGEGPALGLVHRDLDRDRLAPVPNARYPSLVPAPPSAPPTLGLRHAALRVHDLAAAERFFTEALGYRVEWRPDPENVYLIRSHDNVALHRVAEPPGRGQLDHLGLLVASADDVDAWATWLEQRGVPLVQRPRTHRDGARSLYAQGPEGLVVQVIHHPPAL